MTELHEYDSKDFFSDESFVGDPYPYFDALRSESPVRREPHHGVMLVTGYDEAAQVAQDADAWSSCISVTGPFPGFPVPLEGDDVSDLIAEHRDKLPMNDQLPVLDPPEHTKHRALMMKLITPKRLKENEDEMTGVADRLLDEFLAKGSGEFISQFAAQFSLHVIADLLGVPDEDRIEFVEALQRRPQAQSTLGQIKSELSHSPMEFLYLRFTDYINDRRANPRQDVLTGMATATFPDGSTPEVMDVVRIAANVFSAGQETTVRLLSSALLIIAENPDLQARLRADASLIPNFIEETLRTESPIKGDFRLARKTTEVGGIELKAGTMAMILNGAANRDPRHFEDPNTFDLERKNARHHMAFGRGIHTCPGAPLARAEARTCIERILAKTTDIRLSEQAHGPAGDRRFMYLPTYILRGLAFLGLEFDLAEEGA
ncbi:cytochrome P450 [Actinocorallia herbida]|uniref:Cytochrome P450 n=1 Tax=Actinocorallia herbida TaxID=58109 RepID=A0A3N1CXV2_9ACTN|nr:cytochrome P450 [Actinocorallia herbida]ROO85558.1 cytochrome P450 [Actinocorallia herbida]